MSVGEAKKKISATEFIRTLLFYQEELDKKAETRKKEEYYLAQIAYEIHLLRAQSWISKDPETKEETPFPFRPFNKFFFPELVLPEPEKVEEEPETEEEKKNRIALQKAMWKIRMGGAGQGKRRKKKEVVDGSGKTAGEADRGHSPVHPIAEEGSTGHAELPKSDSDTG